MIWLRWASTCARTSFERCACRRSQMMSHILAILACRALRNWTICGLLIEPLNNRKQKSPVTQAGDHRELLPAEAVLQHGRLALRGPGSCATRSLGQTRLVDEDDYSALSRSDFFGSGHLLTFHCRTTRSSRSRAWPVGRRTLQPSHSSNPQAEEATIFTTHLPRSVARSEATSTTRRETWPTAPLL